MGLRVFTPLPVPPPQGGGTGRGERRDVKHVACHPPPLPPIRNSLLSVSTWAGAQDGADDRKQGQTGETTGAVRRCRFRDRVASPRHAFPRRGGAVRVPAGAFSNSAGRPRRGALCPGFQADGRDRGLRRHPLSGRDPLQEADRHLLAAGRHGENRRGAAGAQRHDPDRRLSNTVVSRRHRCGAADLLGGARLRVAARRGAGWPDAVRLDHAWRRGAARQDRRRAARVLRRGHGRARARLHAGAGHHRLCLPRGAGEEAAAVAAARHFLDRAGGGRADQGTADLHVRRVGGGDADCR